MIFGISSTFSLLESSSKSLWKFVDSRSNRIGLFPPNPNVSFASPVAVGLRRRLLAPIKGSPSSPLPAATLAFVSRRRKSPSAVDLVPQSSPPLQPCAAAVPVVVVARGGRHRGRQVAAVLVRPFAVAVDRRSTAVVVKPKVSAASTSSPTSSVAPPPLL
ncbi:hypothetical protein [Oryza sativa Japonica Group]|uniref:Uncharacterized protein n=1 Tax=Oryza sativa subsp. japonica TaxID=39947 RepID=Q5NAV1_ORYSJ|nr:hypothetical protein [Oryza sativa Japonica Group]